jgi:hypothetical protein
MAQVDELRRITACAILSFAADFTTDAGFTHCPDCGKYSEMIRTSKMSDVKAAMALWQRSDIASL